VKHLTRLLTCLGALCLPACAQPVLLEAEQFAELGGWDVDQQSMDQMGSPYLLAHGLGVPVRDAVTSAKLPAAGRYRLWVRTRDWVAPWKAPGAPGRFQVLIDGQPLATTFGTEGAEWHWQAGGEVTVGAQAKIALHDLTGFEGRCDALVLSNDPTFTPPNDLPTLGKLRRAALGLPEQPEDGGSFDLVVVGGGIAGTAAAISAARNGLRVALVQDRPVLGGNGSSEVRVWPEGRTRLRPFQHIGEIVEEFTPPKRAGDANAGHGAIFADQRKLDAVKAEPRLTTLLEQRVNAVEVKDGRIVAVIAQHIRSARRLRLAGKLFADCTGDAAVGALAGADHEVSKEGAMGSSNLWSTLDVSNPAEVLRCECKDKEALSIAVEQGRTAAPFPRCPWALDLSNKPFPGRKAAGKTPRDLGGWFWESGFDRDSATDIERIRDNNFRAMYGAWDTLKNVDGLYPNHRIGWAAFIAGKRESRRLLGDLVLSGADFRELKPYPDGCYPCTWHIDVHTPHPAYNKDLPGDPFISTYTRGKEYEYKGPYWAPYRTLYSRNIANLFMAGRNVSVNREALGAVRVMRTCGMMGEIVGKAAWICVRHATLPRGVYEKHLDLLKELMAQPGAARRDTLDGKLVLPAGAKAPAFSGPGLDPAKLPGVVVDDEQAELTGSWSETGNLAGYVGAGYQYSADPKATARFRFEVKETGLYEVRLAWQPHENRAKALQITIATADGDKLVTVDQSKPASGEHGFGMLGRFRFEAGKRYSVLLKAADAKGAVHCDAVQVVAVK